jgi:Flp pilus assembly protein TadD
VAAILGLDDSGNEVVNAEALMERGGDLLAADDAAGAVEAFRAAVAADGGLLDARHGLVRALGEAERFDEAIAAARELVALTPDDPLAHTGLSIALQQGGFVPEAEAAAGRARILEWKQQLAEPSAKEADASA